jgi:hypothetical protein
MICLTKILRFSDYFICNTHAGSTILVERINSSIRQDGIGIKGLYEIDFSIPDSLSLFFNFDNYEIGSLCRRNAKGNNSEKQDNWIYKG